MDRHFPDALAVDFERLIDGISLPDPGDRHVLAAAIKGQADVIVTQNLEDFPQEQLDLCQIEAIGVKHLALFGSYSTGDKTAASDIDIGVAFDQAVKRKTMTYFGVRQRLQDRLAAILDTEIDLSDEDMQRPAVRETYQAGRVYAF